MAVLFESSTKVVGFKSSTDNAIEAKLRRAADAASKHHAAASSSRRRLTNTDGDYKRRRSLRRYAEHE